MARVGLIMAGLALVTVTLSMLIPVLGWFIVAPLTALIVGAGAGWWASKVMGYGTAGRGAGAGTLAGMGALFGAVIGAVLFAIIASRNPSLQRQYSDILNQAIEQSQQQNPGQDVGALRNVGVGTVLGIGGAIGGGCIGLVNLFLAMLGGLVAGVVYGRNRGPAAVAANLTMYPPGTQPPNAGLPTMRVEGEQGGARIYPDEQRKD